MILIQSDYIPHSIKELQQTATELNQKLAVLLPDGQSWQVTQERLAAVNGQLKEIKSGIANQ